MNFFWSGFEKRATVLHGGRAEGMPDNRYPKGELREGEHHEMEHTDESPVAKQIAKDHLEEDRHYYEHLKEKKLAFWSGFQKKAQEDSWLAEEKDEEKALKERAKIPFKIDPRELSEWRGPEQTIRTWP